MGVFLWVAKTLGIPIGKSFGKWFVRESVYDVVGTPEERAMSIALKEAVAAAAREFNPPDANRLIELTDRGNAAEALALIIRDPGVPLDMTAIRAELERGGYQVDATAFDIRGFMERVQDEFVRRLPAKDAGRAPHLTARVEQIYQAVTTLTSERPLDIRGTGALEVVREMFEMGRARMREGEFEEADKDFLRTLEALRVHASAAPAEQVQALRQRLVLARANLAFRTGDRARSMRLLTDARADGPFVGDRVDPAGLILLNVGAYDEAFSVLSQRAAEDQSGRILRAVAALSVGRYPAFLDAVGSESAVDDFDTLSALTRYHIERGATKAALATLRRLIAKPRLKPSDWDHPANSVAHFVASYAANDIAEWVDLTDDIPAMRQVLEGARAIEPSMRPSEREVIRFARVQFHQALREFDTAEAARRDLADCSPREAARLLLAVATADADGLITAAAALDDLPQARFLQGTAALLSENFGLAQQLFEEGANAAQGDLRDQLLGLWIEARHAAGSDLAECLGQAEAIQAARIRTVCRTSLFLRAGRFDDALRGVTQAQEARPNDLQLMRMLADLSLQLVSHPLPIGESVRAVAREQAERVTERLRRRLSCPEHDILRVRSLLRTNAYDDAAELARTVADSGYETAQLMRLRIALARFRGRTEEVADLTRDYIERYGGGADEARSASEAALAVGRLEDAGRFLDVADRFRDPEHRVALAINRAMLVKAECDRENRSDGVERAFEIIQAAYEAGHDPALATQLLRWSIGTAREAEVVAIVARDFGSLGALPGISAIESSQLPAMIANAERNAEQLWLLWRLGVLPFVSFARATSNRTWELWSSLRVGRQPILTGGLPELQLESRPGMRARTPDADRIKEPEAFGTGAHISDRSARALQAAAFARGRLLLDTTAIFSLADADLLAPLTAATGVQGRLLVARDFYEDLRLWSIHQTVEAPSGDAGAIVAVDDIVDRYLSLRRLAGAGDGTAAAAVIGTPLRLIERAAETPTAGGPRRDAAAIPPSAATTSTEPENGAYNDTADGETITEAQMAFALLTNGLTTTASLAHAHKVDARAFPETFTGSPQPDIHRAVRATTSQLLRWYQAGMLDSLLSWPGGITVDDGDRRTLQAEARRARAERSGDALGTNVWQWLNNGLQSGALALADPHANPDGVPALAEHSLEDIPFDQQDSKTPAPDGSLSLPGAPSQIDGESVARDAESILRLAADNDAVLICDDGALHFALQQSSLFLSGMPPLARRLRDLGDKYRDVRVVDVVQAIALWESEGVIGRDVSSQARRRLALAGHWFVLDGEVLADAAAAPDDDAESEEILQYLERGLSVLPVESLMRAVLPVARVAAQAMGLLVRRTGDASDLRRGVARVLRAVSPWMDMNRPFALISARVFWPSAMIDTLSLPTELASGLWRSVLETLSASTPRPVALIHTLPSALEAVLRIPIGAPGVLDTVQNSLAAMLLEVFSVKGPRGEPWIAHDLAQIAAGAVGLVPDITRYATVAQAGSTRVYSVSEAAVIDHALAELRTWRGAHDDADAPADLVSRVTMPISDDQGQTIQLCLDVDRVFLLPHANGAERRLLCSLIARQQDAYAPELAGLTRQHQDALSLDGDAGFLAINRYFRVLLGQPRLWLESDVVYAIKAAHEQSAATLRQFCGDPPVWYEAEDVASYASRMSDDADGIAEARLRRALFDGSTYITEFALHHAVEAMRRNGLLDAPQESVAVTESSSGNLGESPAGPLSPTVGDAGHEPLHDPAGVDGEKAQSLNDTRSDTPATIEEAQAASAPTEGSQPQQAPSMSQSASGAGKTVEQVASALFAQAVMSGDPYFRLQSLGAAMWILLVEDSATMTFTSLGLREDVATPLHPLDGVSLPRLVGDLAAALIRGSRGGPTADSVAGTGHAPTMAPSPDNPTAGDTVATSISAEAERIIAHNALHSQIARCCLDIALSPAKLGELQLIMAEEATRHGDHGPSVVSSASTNATPAASTGADDAPQESVADDTSVAREGDLVGTALVITLALTDTLMGGAVAQVTTVDEVRELSNTLAQLRSQRGYAFGNMPKHDLLVHDVLGVGSNEADPYSASLLLMIEHAVRRAATLPAYSDGSLPAWYTTALADTINFVAEQAVTHGEQFILDRAAAPDHEDRFSSLFRVPLNERARCIRQLAVSSPGSAPPTPAAPSS